MTATSTTVPPALGRITPRFGPLLFLRRLFRTTQAQLGGALVLLLLLTALFAPALAPHDPYELMVGPPMAPPSPAFPFGTDDLGRDMLSRIMFGSRITVKIGVISVALALGIGVTIGLVAGFYGGAVDSLLMRFTDLALAFPGFLLTLAIVAVLGPGLNNAMIAVGIGAFPGFARLVRGSVLSIRETEYGAAARVLGATPARIIVRSILPNAMAPIVVLATLAFPLAVLDAAALSFLGLGAQPPTPEWGALLIDGRNYLRTAPHLVNIPGAAIFATVLGFNLIGNSLRDALDPRLRAR
ncbi:MAG TPA: ABC transporter permease [Thermomicrobiales bacterium]|nr:ABC transporter permease [Thermomicrobiales bacterium]